MATIRRGKRITIPVEFPVPHGYPDQMTLYVNNVKYDYDEASVVERLNEPTTWYFTLYDVTKADTNIVEGNNILFFAENELFIKGRISEVEWQSDGYARISGIGMEILLRDAAVDRTTMQESATASNTIISKLCSKGYDGSSPWLIEVGTNTNWGDITARFENADRLQCAAGIADIVGYDWWIDQTDATHSTDRFNIDTQRGSVSSVYTFNSGGSTPNCDVVNRQKNEDSIINYIRVLGYGDGVNQVETSFYDAASSYTTLDETLTSSDTTISVVDASNLAASGTIIIAEEQITYSGKSTNDLTGCVRGANSTTAKTHPSGIYVAKYVNIGTPPENTNAESGSSINTNGLKEATYTDTGLIDEDLAELIGSKLMIDRLSSVNVIQFSPFDDPPLMVQLVNMGDVVTVSDSDTGFSSDEYRVVSREYYSGLSGDDALVFTLSTKRPSFKQTMSATRTGLDNQARVMQGDMVAYMSNKEQNCDSGDGLRLDFYLPDETVNVNSLKLNYTIRKYRVDSTVAASDAHTHTVSGKTSSEESDHSHSVTADTSTNLSTTSIGGGSEAVGTTFVFNNANTWYGFSGTAKVMPSGSNFGTGYALLGFWGHNIARTFYIRLKNTTDTAYYPNSTGIQVKCPADGYFSLTIPIPSGAAGDTVQFEAKVTVVPTTLTYVNLYYDTISGHTHNVDSQTALNDGAHTHTVSGQSAESDAHTHALTYGISEDAGGWGVSDMTIEIDGVDKTTEYEAANGTLTVSEDGTDGNNTLATSLFTGLTAGSWHNIVLKPNNNCRIDAQLYVQLFMKGTVVA